MSTLSKRRRELRSELSLIEKQIYDLETNYLEETKDFGNIFTGWNSYVSHDKVKIRKNILTEDRLFSLSSVTSPASRREEFKKSGKAAEAAARTKVRKAQKKKDVLKSDENLNTEESKSGLEIGIGVAMGSNDNAPDASTIEQSSNSSNHNL